MKESKLMRLIASSLSIYLSQEAVPNFSALRPPSIIIYINDPFHSKPAKKIQHIHKSRGWWEHPTLCLSIWAIVKANIIISFSSLICKMLTSRNTQTIARWLWKLFFIKLDCLNFPDLWIQRHFKHSQEGVVTQEN